MSIGNYFLHCVVALTAQKVHPEIFPELLVPDAINDGAQEPRQDVNNQVVCKPDFQDPTREDDVQDDLDARGDVGEHAHGQLDAVEEDSVPGFLGRRLLAGEGPGCKQDPQVGEDQNQKHAGEIDDIKGFPFFSQDHIFEDILTQAEHRLVEETQRFRGQSHKQVCDIGSHTNEPNQPNHHVGPPYCADLRVPQGRADGYVTLYGHAGQVHRSVSSGEDCHQDEEAAERDVEHVENVAEDEKSDGHGQLNAIVDHHVDEQDVTRIVVKNLSEDETQRKEYTSASTHRNQCCHQIKF